MNVTLIGMPGAGKSTIGKKAAEVLSYRFIDIDDALEQKEGLRIPQLLASKGEKLFLEMEGEAVLSLDLKDDCIISPGGSIVYVKKAMAFLKKRSIVVFLDYPLSVIKKRLNDVPRGIVGLGEKNLEEIYSERQALYRKYADVIIELTEKSTPEEVIKEITNLKSEKDKNFLRLQPK